MTPFLRQSEYNGPDASPDRPIDVQLLVLHGADLDSFAAAHPQIWQRIQDLSKGTQEQLRALSALGRDSHSPEAAHGMAQAITARLPWAKARVTEVLLPREIVADLNRHEAWAFSPHLQLDRDPALKDWLLDAYWSTRRALEEQIQAAVEANPKLIMPDVHSMDDQDPVEQIELNQENLTEYLAAHRQGVGRARVSELITQTSSGELITRAEVIQAVQAQMKMASSETYQVGEQHLNAHYASLLGAEGDYIGLEFVKSAGGSLKEVINPFSTAVQQLLVQRHQQRSTRAA